LIPANFISAPEDVKFKTMRQKPRRSGAGRGKSRFRVNLEGGLLTVLLLTALALAANSAERFLSVAELSAQAEAVVRAEITGVSGRMADTPQGRFPFFFYQARSQGLIAGACPQEFTIRVPGLLSQGRIVAMAEAPALGLGSQAVFFLRRAGGTRPEERVYELVGLGQGVLPMAAAPAGETIVLLPSPRPASANGRASKVRLSDFAGEVKAIRENQAREKKP
jgi:hypothetical protein